MKCSDRQLTASFDFSSAPPGSRLVEVRDPLGLQPQQCNHNSSSFESSPCMSELIGHVSAMQVTVFLTSMENFAEM